jgi:hypothetical protein
MLNDHSTRQALTSLQTPFATATEKATAGTVTEKPTAVKFAS